MPGGVEHDVVRERPVPRDGASLRIDVIVDGRELVQEVEGFEAEDEFAFHERLTEGCVHDEVVAIEVGAAVAVAVEHGGVGCEGEASDLCAAEGGCGVAGFETVL